MAEIICRIFIRHPLDSFSDDVQKGWECELECEALMCEMTNSSVLMSWDSICSSGRNTGLTYEFLLYVFSTVLEIGVGNLRLIGLVGLGPTTFHLLDSLRTTIESLMPWLVALPAPRLSGLSFIVSHHRFVHIPVTISLKVKVGPKLSSYLIVYQEDTALITTM